MEAGSRCRTSLQGKSSQFLLRLACGQLCQRRAQQQQGSLKKRKRKKGKKAHLASWYHSFYQD